MVRPRRLLRLGERGQAVEYALILVLLAVGLVTALMLLSRRTKQVYADSAARIVSPSGYTAPGSGMGMGMGGGSAGRPVTSVAPSDSTGSADSPDSVHILARSDHTGGWGW